MAGSAARNTRLLGSVENRHIDHIPSGERHGKRHRHCGRRIAAIAGKPGGTGRTSERRPD